MDPVTELAARIRQLEAEFIAASSKIDYPHGQDAEALRMDLIVAGKLSAGFETRLR